MKRVLITGGSGLVGHALVHFFNSKGWEVRILSRRAHTLHHAKVFLWDVERHDIDERAFENCDLVIHLAGAGVAEKRWTAERKKEILESRTHSTKLLFQYISQLKKKPKHVICASGANYYGDDTHARKRFDENAPKGKGFLADVVQAWEEESKAFFAIDELQTTIFRIGAVMSSKGGALEKMMQPIQLGVGASLGSGKQWVPWVHIQDLCQMMYWAWVEKKTGVFNAVAPDLVSNQQLTRMLARVLKKSLWLPNVPKFVLKLMLGELAVLVLEGNAILPKRLEEEGFVFHYPELEKALRNLLEKKN